MFITEGLHISKRESCLLIYLEREYSTKILQTVLLPLISQTSPVSLRALDWAVVNYTKKNNIICSSRTPGQMTNIHNSYRKTLSFWKRRLFDPFRRRSRIGVMIDGKQHETTLGQANFALWSYRTGVLAYVMGHIDSIEEDMNNVAKRQKVDKANKQLKGTAGKRKELTRSVGGCCVAYVSPVLVHFS